MGLDAKGREVPEGEPLEWPLGLRRPLTIQEEIKRFVREEMSRAAAAEGFESLDEANDFEVEDDEGDHAYGMDVMELAADKRYEDALEEFDAGLAAAQQKKVPEAPAAGPPANAPPAGGDAKDSTPS